MEEKWVSERLLGTLVRMGTLLTESLPLERSKEFRWALVWRTVGVAWLGHLVVPSSTENENGEQPNERDK